MRTVGLIFTTPEAEEKPELFACPHCGKECKTAASLKTHCKKEHPQSFDNEE